MILTFTQKKNKLQKKMFLGVLNQGSADLQVGYATSELQLRCVLIVKITLIYLVSNVTGKCKSKQKQIRRDWTRVLSICKPTIYQWTNSTLSVLLVLISNILHISSDTRKLKMQIYMQVWTRVALVYKK